MWVGCYRNCYRNAPRSAEKSVFELVIRSSRGGVQKVCGRGESVPQTRYLTDCQFKIGEIKYQEALWCSNGCSSPGAHCSTSVPSVPSVAGKRQKISGSVLEQVGRADGSHHCAPERAIEDWHVWWQDC